MTELACRSYAVGHANEGVCLCLHIGPYRVLLDCGMADIHSLTTSDHPPADVVLCSHAHPDHARGLRALHQVYPKLPIYASDVTSRLVEFNWEGPTPRFCQTVSWRSPLQLAPQLTLQLWPAGHFPGAAVAVLTYEGEQTYKAVYAADLTLSNSRLVDGFPLEELRNLKPDVLIIEGNYGTARHPRRRQQENQLAAKISQSLSHQRSVVLPTSVLGMGPELLMLLRSHHHFTGQDINIWVSDGIADVCDTYLKLLDNFPATVQNFARHQALFWDDRIRPYVRRLGSVSQVVAQRSDLNILIAEPSTNLELCYDLYPGPWLMMLPDKPGRPSPVAAQVRAQVRASERLQASLETGALLLDTYLLNSHCDGAGTLQAIHNIRPQHVVFVHGSPSYLTDLTSVEDLQNRYHLHLPSADTLVELPVSDTFIQPELPDTHHGGELTELKTAVLITLDQTIASEPRWRQFADTGIIEARWQGNELVLRGVEQREILNNTSSASMVDCCDSCQYYRGQRCWNEESALFGFHVTPEGYCPVYESAYGESLDGQ